MVLVLAVELAGLQCCGLVVALVPLHLSSSEANIGSVVVAAVATLLVGSVGVG